MCSGPSLLYLASGELLWFSRLSDYDLLSGVKGASSSSPSSIWVGCGGWLALLKNSKVFCLSLEVETGPCPKSAVSFLDGVLMTSYLCIPSLP